MLTVTFGKSTRKFYTQYHAQQFVRALQMNGTPATLQQSKQLAVSLRKLARAWKAVRP